MPLLSEIIGKYIQLYTYTSSEKSGLCPFHNDKSIGNFLVNDNKNYWHCFSCGATFHGNPKIAFLVQYLNISEGEARRIF